MNIKSETHYSSRTISQKRKGAPKPGAITAGTLLQDRVRVRNATANNMYGEEPYRYIARFVDIDSQTTEIMSTPDVFDVRALNGKPMRSIVNLKRMNEIENANEFLAGVNRKLPYNGLYIGCVETL